MKRLLPLMVLLGSACVLDIRPPEPCCMPPGTPSPSPTPTPTPRPPRPTPTPEPTPPPSGGSLLLHTQGQRFVDGTGAPVDLKLFASCCYSEEPEPSPDWSMISEEYLDYLTPLYGGPGKLIVHIRLGPWIPQPDFPQTIQQFGPPYEPVGGGKVDLFRWHAPFWNRFRQLTVYAKNKGVRFEVDLVDGWACKNSEDWHEHNLKGYHPWLPTNNVQGLDAYADCGKVEVGVGQPGTPMAVYEQWVRKIVDTVGDLDNVTWHDGNEIILVSGYTPAWSAGLANVARDQEARKGFPRHLFATNAPQTTAPIEQVDYVTIHTDQPMSTGPSACNTTTKPCINNEYNPNPPMLPEAMNTLRCDAESKGLIWGYWRHGQSYAQSQQTWELLNQACSATTGCLDIPNIDAIEDDSPGSKYTEQINHTLDSLKAKGIVAPDNFINMPMRNFLPLFAQEARALYPQNCAGQQTDNHGPVDEVCFGSKEYCQGYHAMNCKGASSCPPNNPDCGCDTGFASYGPGSARDGWMAPGSPQGADAVASALKRGERTIMTRQGRRDIFGPWKRERILGKQSGSPLLDKISDAKPRVKGHKVGKQSGSPAVPKEEKK